MMHHHVYPYGVTIVFRRGWEVGDKNSRDELSIGILPGSRLGCQVLHSSPGHVDFPRAGIAISLFLLDV